MRLTAPLAAALLLLPLPALADEGMWPFDMVPVQRIAQEHQVQLTPQWLDHVRLSSVRFNSGGSGSFVSPRGLVLTNHHVASDCIAKIASASHDFLETGYLAGKDGPEVPCPDLELDQLQSIEDVTPRVLAARQPGASDADANKAMKAQMAAIEKECHDSTGLRCDVVTLYAGAMYRLYRYQRFTDVRLVFAPEQTIAFFGGDPDNFNYPRFDLDLALFRVYGPDKQPVDSHEFFLPWSPRGPKDGDAVFVSGHPGRTERDDTMAQLETLRDVVYPRALARNGAWRAGLVGYSKTGAEEKRQARESIFGVENSLKAYTGFEGGLRDAALMKKKADEEKRLRAAVDASPELKAKYGGTWDEVARVQKAYATMYPRFEALESSVRGTLLSDARDLVRLPSQHALPNEQRLPEYRETKLDEMKTHVLAPAAIYPGVEQAFVEEWLVLVQKALGDKDPAVQQVLAGRTPQRAAREIVAQSRLFDTYARRTLWEGGQAAVDASTDPMIVAMRTLEPAAIAVRKQYDDGVEAPMRALGRKVAEAKFAVVGTSVAPDATFTLRLSPGVVRGYEEHGKRVPWATDFAGLYKHATGVEPLKLPPRWIEAKGRLLAQAASTPMNFVSTNDIIGGNSGSPVVGASGELVGLIFDGNLPSLPDRFIYQDTTARAVSVDTAAMLEALRTVYGADALAQELISH
jgi:S1-C subfamily serine protease